jgi:hypothetical protein
MQQTPVAAAAKCSPPSPASRKKQLFQRYQQEKAAAAATKHAVQPQKSGASTADCADDDCEDHGDDSWGGSFSGSGWSEDAESLYSEEEVSSARPLPQLRQLLQQHSMLLR